MEAQIEEEGGENGNFIGLHRLPDMRRGDPSGGLDHDALSAAISEQWAGTTDSPVDERKTKAQLLEETGVTLGS